MDIRTTRSTRKHPTHSNKHPSKRPAKGPDKPWFDAQFAQAGLSQRQAAAKAGMDPAQLNRALKGTRRFQSHELDALARALGLSSLDVMQHTPYSVTSGATVTAKRVPLGQRQAAVVGRIDGATGSVQFNAAWPQTERAALAVDGVPFLVDALVLVQAQEVKDASTLAGHIAIVRLDDGTLWLRAMRPGFKAGHWDLGPALGIGADRQDDVAIAGAMWVEGLDFGRTGGGD